MRLESLEDRTLLSGPDQFVPRGISGGGALYFPSFSPHNPDEFYLATDMSQMFHTLNGGQSWDFYAFDELRWSNKLNGVQFTSAPNVLYATDATTGLFATPLKSIDGGQTWLKPGDPGFASNWPGSERAARLYADPESSQRILVQSADELFFSNDGGATFVSMLMVSGNGPGLHTGGAFFNGSSIFVASNQGLVLSTDNGATFNVVNNVSGLPNGEVIYSLAGAVENGVTRLFAITVPANQAGSINPPISSVVPGLYTIDWGQASWTNLASKFAATDRFSLVATSRYDIDTAYVAAQSQINTFKFPTVFKTTDGGQSWANTFQSNANVGNPNPPNANIETGWIGANGDRGFSNTIFGLAVSPIDPNDVMISDGFVPHLTTDGGASWRQVYVPPDQDHAPGANTPKADTYSSNGLNNTTVWWIEWSDSNNIFAANDDIIGQRSTDGGTTWAFDRTGLTGEVYHIGNYQLPDPNNPGQTRSVLVASTGTGLPIYSILGLDESPQFPTTGKLYYSLNKGANWSLLYDFGDQQVVWSAIDPANPSTMYATASKSFEGGVYVAYDVVSAINNGTQATFGLITNAPARTEGHPLTVEVIGPNQIVTTYSGRRPKVVPLTFTDSSGVFVVTVDSATKSGTWIDETHPGMHYWTKDLIIDPHNPQRWYVCVRLAANNAATAWPSDQQGVYMTPDAGNTWHRIFDKDAENVAVNPTNQNELYIASGTDGLYIIENALSVDANGKPNPTYSLVDSFPHPWPQRVFYNPYNPGEVWVAGNGSGLMVGVSGQAAGAFNFSAANTNVNENAGTATITVTRTGDLVAAMTVDYLVTSGAATSGSDFTTSTLTTGITGTLTFLAGQSSRTFTIQVLDDALAESNETIQLTLLHPSNDNLLGNVNTATVTIVDNDSPTLSDIADLTIDEDTTTGPLAFSVSDAQTPAANLTVSGTSSNQSLVPNTNIVFGGSGTNRTVSVAPAANQSGSATITVTVTDESGATASGTFLLTVNAVNDVPTISDIADQATAEDTPTAALAFTIADVETAAADLTVSASSSNTALVPDGNIIFGGSGANRTVTLTPAANQSGTATITVTVSDGTASASDTFVLTVNSVNDLPTISDISDQTTDEDTATGAIAFTVGDVETPATDLTVTGSSSNTALVPDANIVFGESGANRTVTLMPAANQSGTATITVTVSDGTDSASDTFVLTVSAVNDAPTITDIGDQTTEEDTPTGAIAFTIGDVETAAADLTVSASSSNTALVPDANIVFGGSAADRTVTVTPAAHQSGTATITVTVSDGVASASDTFVLTVNAVNDPPTISDIADRTTDEDTPTGALGFTIGDVETAAADLTVSASSSNTTLVPSANIVFGGSGTNRTVTVTPAANQSGTATITVTVSDGTASTSDTFLVTVNAVNDVPTISDIADQSTDEDVATGALAFTIGDVETTAADLTVTGSSSNTTLVPNANIAFGGNGTNRTVTITPAADKSGTATITVTVSDGSASTNDTFVLTVNAVNDLPTISDIADQTTAEDTPTGALAFTIGDVETAAADLTVSASSSNTTLVPEANIVLAGSGSNRTVTLTPAANQSGTATITITVSDGTASASDTFVLTVNAVNDLPTISDIADQTTNEDTATGALAFTIGDVETAAADLTVSASSSNTTLVPNGNIILGGSGADRTVTIAPAANQFGTATITVTVTDLDGGTATDTFVLTVNAVNDLPTISDTADQTTNEDVATGVIVFTVGDVETPTASLTVTGSSSNTTLVPNGAIVFGGSGTSRTVSVAPAADQFGTATITVTVTDSDGGAATDTFVLTVNAVNDLPTISDTVDQTTNEDVATGAIAFTVGDVETATGSLTVSGSSSNTTLVPEANIVLGGSGANRIVTVTPAANQSGTATITVTVSDGTASTSDTFVLTVNAVNDLPTISDVADQTTAEDTPTGALAFTIGDVETAAADLTVSASSSNTTLVPEANVVLAGSGANRTVTITPAANQSGTATITVTVSDGTASTSDTFVLTVNAVNDLPTISDVADQSTDEDVATGALAFTIGGVETTAAADLTVTGSSSNTTLVPNANIAFGGNGTNRTVTITPAADKSGTATITVTVSDGSASASDTFVLTVNAVNDVPTISDIADQTTAEDTPTGALAITIGDVETAAADLTVSASSSNTTLVPNANIVFGGSGASRTVTITPAANRSGTATITVTISDDAAGNTENAFTVTVRDTTGPAVTVAGDVTAEATSAAGAAVAFSAATWTDAVDGSGTAACDRSSGETFAIGATTITCSQADAAGNTGSNSFTVTVRDTTPPVLADMPPNRTLEATGTAGTAVAFPVPTASDTVTATPAVACAPATGSTFTLGTTSVTCRATDAAGNSRSATFSITVQDSTGPVLDIPSGITVEADAAEGVIVEYATSAVDLVDGPVAVGCLISSGSRFGLGTTIVICSAQDTRGNRTTGQFDVTVSDTRGPSLALPSSIEREAIGISGIPVDYPASATDLVDGPLAVACTPGPGELFVVGTTTVTCSTSDSRGNSAAGQFLVTVLPDTHGPLIVMEDIITNREGHRVASVVVPFNEALDPATAGVVANFSLALQKARRTSQVPIKTADYDASSHTVTITPLRPIPKKKLRQAKLVVTVARDVIDLAGNPLEGDNEHGLGVSVAALIVGPLSRFSTDAAIRPVSQDAVDALLDENTLFRFIHWES
jgi:hypothetical protein